MRIEKVFIGFMIMELIVSLASYFVGVMEPEARYVAEI